MNNTNLSTLEIARRRGCTDVVKLAEIERAEYLSGLVHDLCSWTFRKLTKLGHGISVRLVRHAH